jgi:hypothetical protein
MPAARWARALSNPQVDQAVSLVAAFLNARTP